MFNPLNPTGSGAMLYPRSCWRQYGLGTGLACDGQMFGDDAPGATWEYTFTHAQLGRVIPFVTVPSNSIFFSQGLGNTPKAVNQPKKKKKGGTVRAGPAAAAAAADLAAAHALTGRAPGGGCCGLSR